MKRIRGMDTLHHIAFPVRDVSAAVAWYTTQFDVNIAYQDETWALLEFDNVALALALPEQHPGHIAVERSNAEAYGPLTPHRDGTASVYIQDPWQNTIEILKSKGSR